MKTLNISEEFKKPNQCECVNSKKENQEKNNLKTKKTMFLATILFFDKRLRRLFDFYIFGILYFCVIDFSTCSVKFKIS